MTKQSFEAQVGMESGSEEGSSHDCLRGNILERTITSKGRETGLHGLVRSVTLTEEPKRENCKEKLGDQSLSLVMDRNLSS